MGFDLIIANARLADRPQAVDIGIAAGRIARLADRIAEEGVRADARGALAFPGFVEAHIHLDKACILDRCPICEGTLAEAVRETAKAKAAFTSPDVYARAAGVLEQAVLHGTNRMRTFVEVDPRAGFRSLEAILRLKRDYAFAVDLQICAFAQEGLTQEMATYAMLEEALRHGADLVGGCPYTDPRPDEHIRLVFELAQRYGVAIDFHVDFDLDPAGSALPTIIAETEARGYGGRVTIGHVTKLSAMPPADVGATARRLSNAGIGLVVLPATDLFLLGRSADRLVPRGLAPAQILSTHGVTVAAASNNILNPFTPYGDASLARMANLFANVAQLSRDADLGLAFDMVTSNAARVLGAEYGLTEGAPADIVLIDAPDPASAIRRIAPVVAGWKGGRQTFTRPRPTLLRP
ncbi:MAG: amidohydrolase family protein [Devosia sp.]|nr:amidohydrolase family protein [Devosia sp.]